ncbi:PEP-CTERM sorting domain-containing protein [Vibrio alginolyticus]|nr:PEP-CTERM sorting domain-containing protein [Vibrio alginolyticus]
MLKFVKALSVMTCALLLHANAQAGEILIDDFSTNQGPVSDSIVGDEAGVARDGVTPNSHYNQVSTGGNDIIGGYRDIYVEEVDNGIGTGDDPTLGIHVQVSNGRFSATLDDLVKGFAVVTYDGANEVGNNWETGVDTGGLGGEDWSGTTGFLFEDISNDVVAPVQLIVWTNDNMDGVTFVKHTLDFATFGNINDGGLYDAIIPIAWFDNHESINWASVGAFQAVFNLDSTGDIENSEISVDLSLSRAVAVEVPEPAALSMFGAGILMLGFVGSRRRKNQ